MKNVLSVLVISALILCGCAKQADNINDYSSAGDPVLHINTYNVTVKATSTVSYQLRSTNFVEDSFFVDSPTVKYHTVISNQYNQILSTKDSTITSKNPYTYQIFSVKIPEVSDTNKIVVKLVK